MGIGEGGQEWACLRQGGSPRHALCTQAVPTAPDGHPALYASPVAELAADIPLTPRLMGHLVPQSINLWLGATSHGGQPRAPAPHLGSSLPAATRCSRLCARCVEEFRAV